MKWILKINYTVFSRQKKGVGMGGGGGGGATKGKRSNNRRPNIMEKKRSRKNMEKKHTKKNTVKLSGDSPMLTATASHQPVDCYSHPLVDGYRYSPTS